MVAETIEPECVTHSSFWPRKHCLSAVDNSAPAVTLLHFFILRSSRRSLLDWNHHSTLLRNRACYFKVRLVFGLGFFFFFFFFSVTQLYRLFWWLLNPDNSQHKWTVKPEAVSGKSVGLSLAHMVLSLNLENRHGYGYLPLRPCFSVSGKEMALDPTRLLLTELIILSFITSDHSLPSLPSSQSLPSPLSSRSSPPHFPSRKERAGRPPGDGHWTWHNKLQ